MNETIYTAASGAIASQLRLEMLANNLANANATGFKEERALFSAYLPGEAATGATLQPVAEGLSPRQAAAFRDASVQVRFAGTATNFAQGPLQQTGGPLDLAIDGKGFFRVQTPEGTAYTRRGDFTLDRDGNLVTQEGFAVLGGGGPIQIDGQQIIVDEEGRIFVDGTEAGALDVAAFADPRMLTKRGDSLFVPAGGGPAPEQTKAFTLRQGFLEAANVDPVRAMTEMIEVLRAFESYQKAIRSADEANEKAVNEVGKLA